VDRVGDKQLRATSGTVARTSAVFAIRAAAPARLVLVTPPSEVIAGVAMTPAPRVRVFDAFDNVVPLAPVTATLAGTATVRAGSTATTDSLGEASLDGLTIERAGVQRLVLTSGAAGVTSDVFTVAPASAAHLAFANEPSDMVAGTIMAPAVGVRVSDAFDNDVPNAAVELTLEGEGTLQGGAEVLSGLDGIASFANLSLDRSGHPRLLARLGTLVATSAPFTVTHAPAASFVYLTQPSPAVAGATITPAVQLRAVDAFGNPVAGEPVMVTLEGPGTLRGGDGIVTDSLGVATFASLACERAGLQRVIASHGPHVATSDSFLVSPGAVARLAFVTPPSDVVAGDVMTPAVRVRAQDAYDNVVPTAVVALAPDASSAFAGTTGIPTDADGIASLGDLVLTRACRAHLTATSDAVTVTSPDFRVAAASPSRVAFVTQPSDVSTDAVIAPAVTVEVRDRFENPVPQASVSLAHEGPGGFTGGDPTVTDSLGVATFTALAFDRTGSHALDRGPGRALEPERHVQRDRGRTGHGRVRHRTLECGRGHAARPERRGRGARCARQSGAERVGSPSHSSVTARSRAPRAHSPTTRAWLASRRSRSIVRAVISSPRRAAGTQATSAAFDIAPAAASQLGVRDRPVRCGGRRDR
jgi:hypothetical protein